MPESFYENSEMEFNFDKSAPEKFSSEVNVFLPL